ncbi:MAG: hypothetical protein AAFN18_08430 [Cyanobacteria bacterium J06554_6]
MVRVLPSYIVVIGLSACNSARVEIPATVDALAQDCYRAILPRKSSQLPQMERPIAMEDGTLLIQWQISEAIYGSCQVDSGGSVLMITRNEPLEKHSSEAATESTAPEEPVD